MLRLKSQRKFCGFFLPWIPNHRTHGCTKDVTSCNSIQTQRPNPSTKPTPLSFIVRNSEPNTIALFTSVDLDDWLTFLAQNRSQQFPAQLAITCNDILFFFIYFHYRLLWKMQSNFIWSLYKFVLEIVKVVLITRYANKQKL